MVNNGWTKMMVNDGYIGIPPGKRLQFANLNMAKSK